MTFPRPGDRIRLIAMSDDPHPLPAGSTGTVTAVKEHGTGQDAWLQVEVEWDNGRKLMLSIPPDRADIFPGAVENKG